MQTNLRPSDEKQSKRWPQTVKEAVAQILSEMSEKDKETVRSAKKKDLFKFHHGWGAGIRCDMGLWQGNKDLMKDAKAEHPDDASMMIIEAAGISGTNQNSHLKCPAKDECGRRISLWTNLVHCSVH